MCCNNEKQLIKVSLEVINLVSDTITLIGGLAPAGPITGYDLAASNPQFWIEPNMNGEDRLCTTKTMDNQLSVLFNNGVFDYPAPVQAFEVVDFFGGHPVRRPH